MRWRSVAPSCSSSTVTLRLTVDTACRGRGAARLKLSSCATLAKIAMSLRSIMPLFSHEWKIDPTYFHLIKQCSIRQTFRHGKPTPQRRGPDGRQSRSVMPASERSSQIGFVGDADNRLARGRVTSLMSLGGEVEMCVTRPLAVFLGAIILFAATASSSLAQKRTPATDDRIPTGLAETVVCDC